MESKPSYSFFLFVASLFLAASSGVAAPPVIDRGLLPGDLEVSPMTNSQTAHSVARGGDQFLVVWSDARGASVGGGANQSANDVFGLRVDADGNPIDAAPFLVAGGMGNQRDPQVAWSGGAWLVIFISQDPVGGYYQDRLRAVRVAPSGAVLDATPIVFPPTQYEPSTIGLQVAGQGGEWLITRCIYHSNAYGTYLAGQRISSAGLLLDPDPVMLVDWVYGGTELIAQNGEYLAAGPDWTSGTTKAQRVGTNGQPLGAAFMLPGMTLAGNGSEYYVVWVKDYVNLVGSRVTATGVLLTPQGTPIVTNFSQYNQSTLSHDGTNWWFEWGVSDQLHTVRISGGGVVLDPNGGVLLPISIGGNVNTAYSPVMVGRPGGGVHLLWFDYRASLGSDPNVFLLPIGAANDPGSEQCVSTGTHNQRTPDLAAGPNGQSAVVFVSESAGQDRVLLYLVDASGLPLNSEPIVVEEAPAIGRAGVAWNGSVYAVTWDAAPSGASLVRIRRVNANGSIVDANPLEVMPGFSPDIEALGDDFLIACSRVATYPEFINAWMRIIDGPTANFVNAATQIGGGYVSTGPRVHQDGTRWLVVYHSHWTHDDARSDALFNFVSPDGSFTAAVNPTQTSGGAGTPDVAFSGQKYLFVWRNNTLSNANNYIAGRVMNADGSFATGNFTIAEAPGRQLRPVVDWDGSSFVVAWDDQRNQGSFFDERTDVYAARVAESGALLDPNGFVIQASPDGDATAAILSRPNGQSLVASARFITTQPYDSYRVGLSLVGAASTSAPESAGQPTLWLGTSSPNPFAGSTRVSFRAGPGLEYRLSVHDASGREINRLSSRDGVVASWDGRDAQGREVPSGTYYLRLSAGERVVARSVTRIR